ncbi:MAG: sulfotransferase [Pseudomonadota bacterium]|nr:sulfotransferase [Pseudomonadota bacterium]
MIRRPTGIAGREEVLRLAKAALKAGDPARARAVLATPLRLHPDDPAMLSFAGIAHRGLGDTLGALDLLERAVALASDLAPTRLALAEALIDAHRPRRALAMLDALPDGMQRTPTVLLARAQALGSLGDQSREIAVLREAAAMEPGSTAIRLRLGHSLRAIGQTDEALAEYRAILGEHPANGAAWWSIANLRSTRLDAADREAMRKALSGTSPGDDDRLKILFALARCEEVGGNDEKAFALYEEANSLRHRQSLYDPQKLNAGLTASASLFTADFFARRPGHGSASAAPIFIVGMHRSGSTLLEQMLSCHSGIEGTAELPYIKQLMREVKRDAHLAGRSVEHHLASLDAPATRRLGEDYLARAGEHRHGKQAMFLDKMPDNWSQAGFIRLILPKARIIDVRRHPMACGYSNFRQLYATGVEHSYSLSDWGHHYRAYLAFMDKIDVAARGATSRVIYERLVEDPEGELRRLCGHIGIPFEPAMLDFHASKRVVRTISAEQVRRPLNRDAINEWRRFEQWLAPLKEALGDAVDRWNDHQEEE